MSYFALLGPLRNNTELREAVAFLADELYGSEQGYVARTESVISAQWMSVLVRASNNYMHKALIAWKELFKLMQMEENEADFFWMQLEQAYNDLPNIPMHTTVAERLAFNIYADSIPWRTFLVEADSLEEYNKKKLGIVPVNSTYTAVAPIKVHEVRRFVCHPITKEQFILGIDSVDTRSIPRELMEALVRKWQERNS